MKDFEINKTYEGFKLLRNERVEEIDSTAFTFEHEKTGARLLFLENKDSERGFSIGFRTPVDDNTGLPHILEHSVLCGSKNFPIKDPFAYVNKTSISTFLNAFTFPDKTMYPFCTTNETEYRKLMNVYLDAVFNPNIDDQKEIFLQEGWRYQFDEDDNLKINGVVYSEMKGALSSPDSILEYNRLKYCFPDTQYQYNFGGDPKHIPELTYEKFLNFHKTFYHPTNSYIYLYGDLDIVEELKFINNEYLNNYEKINIDSRLKEQPSFEQTRTHHVYYPISEEESTKDKSHIEYNFVVEKATNPQTMIAFDILATILMELPSSPLKKALVKAEVAQDITGSFNEEDVLMQTVLTFKMSNTNLDQKDKIIKIFDDVLRELSENGIDKDLIRAAINRKEFDLIEKPGRYPKPLLIALDVINSWLYDSDPLAHLKYSEHLDTIKKESKSRYFEKLIKKYLIDNNHRALLVLEPKPTINQDKELDEKLRKYKESLSEDEINKIREEEKNVQNWQNKVETQEDINKIKLIDIKDIDKLPQKIDYKEKNVDLGKLLLIKDSTKGINYLNLFFDARVVDDKMVQYLELLTSILLEVKTTKYSLDEFANIRNIYTGGIGVSLIAPLSREGSFMPKIRVNTKYLDENKTKAIEILNELFNNVEFEEKKVKEILNRIKSRCEISIIENGHIFAINNVRSNYSSHGNYIEQTRGIGYYNFIKMLLENFDEQKDEIISNLKEIYSQIFNKNNLITNLVTDNDEYEHLNRIELQDKKAEIYNYQSKEQKISRAYSINSQVNYVAKGYNFSKLGYEFSGANHILRNFLGYGFMWENIRMKGGAYGAMTLIDRENDYIYVTYRDPHIKNTLEVYDDIPKYLEELDMSREEIIKSIIGTISDIDRPLNPSEKGINKSLEYIKEISFDDLCKERKEILNITNDDLREYGTRIRKILDNASVCVIGNETQINENKDLFDEIVNPFK